MNAGQDLLRGKIVGLVLAAGLSSRMGSFKPLLQLDRLSVIASVVGSFRQGGISDMMVVIGHRADEMIPVVEGLGTDFVINTAYRRGMFSSIQTGIGALAKSDCDGCLLLPVDIPLVRPTTIRTLLDTWPRERPPVLYPVFRGRRGHPPLITRALFDEILASDGEGGLRAVLTRHDREAGTVTVYDEGIRRDMDTPEDYAALRILAGRGGIPGLAECEAMLADHQPNGRVVLHSRTVARIAGTLVACLSDAGVPVNPDLVLAGSLLHDIAKGQPDHASVGAALVERLGFPQLSDIIASHTDLNVQTPVMDERAILYLADKLTREDRVVSLEERFQPAMTRLEHNREGLAAAKRRFETAVNVARWVEERTGRNLSQILSDLPSPPIPAEGGSEPGLPR